MKIRNKQSGIIVISTFPDEESSASVARDLINKKLCACVNLTKVRSLYSWNNRLEDQTEYLALFKSTTNTLRELKSNIKGAHPYDVPEIVEIRMSDVSKSYMSWLVESTNKMEKKKLKEMKKKS